MVLIGADGVGLFAQVASLFSCNHLEEYASELRVSLFKDVRFKIEGSGFRAEGQGLRVEGDWIRFVCCSRWALFDCRILQGLGVGATHRPLTSLVD